MSCVSGLNELSLSLLQIGDLLQKRSEPGEKKKTRIATGNWGCGRQSGDVQLKFILQWIAASLAGVKLIYHTAGHEKLSRVGNE